MPHQYSTALSHVFLAGTGIYCIINFNHDDMCQLPCAAFGIIITNSVIGIWRWGNPDHGDKVETPYNHTFFLQTLYVLPCIAGHVWLTSGYEKVVGYLHPMVSCIPLAAYISHKKKNEELIDLIMFLNIISCGVLSHQIDNQYGVAAAVAFAINHFFIKNKEQICDVPGRDFYNYALCFFTYFGYRAVV